MILTAVVLVVGTLLLGALAASGHLARAGREGDHPLVAARGTRFGEVSGAAPLRLRLVDAGAAAPDRPAADQQPVAAGPVRAA